MSTDPYRGAAARAANRYKIPRSLFLSLVNHESGWNPKAISSAGAIGLTQLMPGTAEGLKVDPHDPLANLEGGARYLRSQYDRFGSWKLALAAYNAGPGNVESGAWQHIPETSRYVHSILSSSTSLAAPPANDIVSGKTPTTRSPLPLRDPGVLGDPVSSAAFANLGRIAQGWKPTSTLSDLITAETYAAQSPATALEAPQPLHSSPKSHPLTPPRKFKADGEPVPKNDLTSIGGVHPTSGLAGFPARDYMAPGGSPAVAPVGGKIIRLSGHDPAQGPTDGVHGPFGWSVYIQGNDGHVYYLTHMGSRDVKIGQRVKAGQQIGTVGDYAKFGGADHIHMGVH